ncbi:MAG TPA: ribosome-associated translation inhibitor RaiA [Candidatus Saccharimonadales bacterium]|nr:ribosome-associated translation inhibitor RaiA [Candidatus Saccharimonadales bacterium]
MIRLDVSGNNYDLGDKIVAYVNKKIGGLEKYLPRSAREGVHGRVTLVIDESGREDNQCVCEAIINLPGATLQSKEATRNMFAAVDIVEAKLKAQVHKYKDKHSPRQNRAKVFVSKLLRRSAEE